MTRVLPIAALALMVACAQQPTAPSATHAAPEALVSITDGGELVEVQRRPEYSVIEVRSAPSGSVPSSLFVLRGACAVARARGKAYFTSTPVVGAARAFRLSFPETATDAQLRGRTKSVVSLDECNLLRF